MEKETRIIDLSKILKPYSDEWVALSNDEKKVVASAKTLEKAINMAKEKGEKFPIMTKVPKDYCTFVL
jgi:glycerol-3-phosphate dehydrogenase